MNFKRRVSFHFLEGDIIYHFLFVYHINQAAGTFKV
jgi:hypothetical protein